MHEIFGSRFVGVRAPAWHQLGTVLEEPVPVKEALQIAGIDFTYIKSPLQYITPDGQTVGMENKNVILRSPTADDPQWAPMGTASDTFAVLPNDELAEGLDDIISVTGWELETVGALRNGETIFMSLALGENHVKTDQYNSYMLVSDSKSAGRSLQITMVPIRVVCANTLNAAIAAATFDVKIRHHKTASEEYEFWTGLIPQMQHREAQVFEALDAMADAPVSDAEAKHIISLAYPLPIMSTKLTTLTTLDAGSARTEKLQAQHEYWYDYAVKHREAAYTLYERFNDSDEAQATNNASVAGTAYAALQAVTELADWAGGGPAAGAAMSSLYGDRAKVKARAWKAAEALAY